MSQHGHENESAVRRILATSGWTLVRDRRPGGVHREVFLTGDGYVVKRFTHPGAPPRVRRPWAIEHRALERLGGRGAPRPVGYVVDELDHRVTATLVRHYLEGEPVGPVDEGLLGEIAGLLAGFHEAGVATNDAHLSNFVRMPDGRLGFLDFGRARVFRRASPLLYAGVAMELHRFRRTTTKQDEDRWRAFLEAYFRRSPFGRVGNRLVRALLAIDMWRYGLRKRGR